LALVSASINKNIHTLHIFLSWRQLWWWW